MIRTFLSYFLNRDMEELRERGSREKLAAAEEGRQARRQYE